MNRRDFIRYGLAATAAHPLSQYHGLNGAQHELDRFGGWTGKGFEATGYFRMEKDERWWMVTPDGNAFLSFGINHLFPDLWNQDYNRAVWKNKLGVKELHGPNFQEALRNWFLDTCKHYGFNTVGVHNSLYITNTPRPALPYLQPIRIVDIPHWQTEVPEENFLDVFSSDFEKHCDKKAKETIIPVKDDPYLMGYSLTDCPLFTEEDLRERTDVIGGARRESRIGWPRKLRNLGINISGKQAYVKLMKNLYRGSIGGFNTTYGTTFRNYDALANAKNWRPGTDLSNSNETRDNLEFLKLAIHNYYRKTLAAIRRYDQNHLFFGDKINANTDSLDTVLPVTTQYTDVVFYQMYARYEVQEPGLNRWSQRVDKPFVNGDSAFTMITDTMPRPYGPIADNLEERIEWTEEFFRNAFARPDFVGWHYCGLIDASQLVPRKQTRQHSGLLDGYGEPYPRLDRVIKSCAENKYSIALGG
jgi:hypothetical protein